MPPPRALSLLHVGWRRLPARSGEIYPIRKRNLWCHLPGRFIGAHPSASRGKNRQTECIQATPVRGRDGRVLLLPDDVLGLSPRITLAWKWPTPYGLQRSNRRYDAISGATALVAAPGYSRAVAHLYVAARFSVGDPPPVRFPARNTSSTTR
jgi:hypothetical protein